MNPVALHAMLDELEKIAISQHRLKHPKVRKWRRSMSVSTWIAKEKDGSLYKDAEATPEPKDKAQWGRATGIGAGVGGLASAGTIGAFLPGALRDYRQFHADGLAQAVREALSYGAHPDAIIDMQIRAAKDLALNVKGEMRKVPWYLGGVGLAGALTGAGLGLGAYGAYRGIKHLVNKKKTAGLIDSAFGGHGYSQESTASPGPQVGKPASGKKKPGDSPSLDEPSSYPKTEQTQTNQSTTAPYRGS